MSNHKICRRVHLVTQDSLKRTVDGAGVLNNRMLVADSMKSTNLSQSQMDKLNSELELLLVNGELMERLLAWRQLNAYIRQRVALRVTICLAVVASVFSVTLFVPILNWTASAYGRLAIIQLLPIWNWTPLYRNQCLIAKGTKTRKIAVEALHSDLECDFCESVDTIHSSVDVSISEFEHNVRFNQPFVIQNAHQSWRSLDICDFILNTKQLANAIPCDLQSNLQFDRSARLNQLFEHTIDKVRANMEADTHHNRVSPSSSPWFMSFRNCEFSATKSLRPLWPRPTFVPLHLRPYHMSWLLMSSQYPRTAKDKSVDVRGLAVIAQLTGMRRITLVGRGNECVRKCHQLSIELVAGDALIYLADKWLLYYSVNADELLSVTFVAEFNWDSRI